MVVTAVIYCGLKKVPLRDQHIWLALPAGQCQSASDIRAGRTPCHALFVNAKLIENVAPEAFNRGTHGA